MFAPAQRTYSTNGSLIHLERPGETVFISHPHSDHVPSLAKTKTALCSPTTLQLLKTKKKLGNSQEVKHDGLEITLLNAGHMLGSSQFYAKGDGAIFTYTGDFKLDDALTTKGAEVRQTDVLLMESTYGSPEYVFPERHESYQEIAKWAKTELEKSRNVLLAGYTVGKAQEIIAALNKYASIAPLTTSSITKANQAYEKNGVRLGYIPVESQEGQEQLSHSFVAVIPFHQLKPELENTLEKAYDRKVSSASCSGWNTSQFCLSDHADFPQLIDYVERAAPKKVYCTNGFTEKLAHELRMKGFDATAV